MNCQRCNCSRQSRTFHETGYEWASDRHMSNLQLSAQYSKVASVLALCQQCWFDLQTADNRFPYYVKLIDYWRTIARTQRDLDRINDMAPHIERNLRSEYTLYAPLQLMVTQTVLSLTGKRLHTVENLDLFTVTLSSQQSATYLITLPYEHFSDYYKPVGENIAR